ncbi:hypothetical protein [Ammoniphilus resinae]|uniref:Uncharacterized protein n=1 Tax=Ammoniphilus resinae TaxID=861532 RepID=A0ABS4GQT7_9BACL|nr:hypothetical protein [Ammoniphilus resinae]MBP1932628.1 hypothetical protein [Ammoniphilus resinae]
MRRTWAFLLVLLFVMQVAEPWIVQASSVKVEYRVGGVLSLLGHL